MTTLDLILEQVRQGKLRPELPWTGDLLELRLAPTSSLCFQDTRTGRFSGVRPNLANVPRGVDWKTMVAIGVCPQCGHSIMQAKDGRQFCTSCDFDPLKYLEG